MWHEVRVDFGQGDSFLLRIDDAGRILGEVVDVATVLVQPRGVDGGVLALAAALDVRLEPTESCVVEEFLYSGKAGLIIHTGSRRWPRTGPSSGGG